MLYVQNDSDQIIAGIDLEEFRSLEGLIRETPYQILFNTSNNTYLHYFNEEMFKSIRLIDWQNNDLYDSLSDILDQEQIISMITRDNIYRSKISKGIYDLEKNFDLQKNIDLLSQTFHFGIKMPKKFITCKGTVLNKKGRVFIMSVKRGVSWPDRSEIVEKLGGEKNVLLLNVTSQSLKYRDTFSPMYIPKNNNYKDEFYCFENWYQSGKVLEGIPKDSRVKWWKDQKKGKRKYPKTDFKKNPVLYAEWNDIKEGQKLEYIESRKLAYVKEYWNLIKDKEQFLNLRADVFKGLNIIVIDHDGPYKSRQNDLNSIIPEIKEVDLELLKEKINDKEYPFGHGYVVGAGLLDIDHDLYTL